MIELRDVSVCFKQKEKEIQAVDSVDLTIEKAMFMESSVTQVQGKVR
ncbi:hypothetical protein NWO25_18970 [Enterococcus lactis]|nr:hypothetical protein [Enterococcus lactis]